MSTRLFAITALAAAAVTLAACGGDEGDDTAPEEIPAADADAPAMDADAPAVDADAPAVDPGTAAVAVTLESVTGLWSENAALCGTDDEVTITAEAVNMVDGACIVTGVEEGDGVLSLDLLCPVAAAEPDTGTWVITATGEAPFTSITVSLDGLLTNLERCP